mmetsp:Transcript_45613/g.40865  ORF Transcript_45613/g.40865 Transcript_45613/m.40865 type:complete len:92 (-) Transcript_45613:205-480(-)
MSKTTEEVDIRIKEREGGCAGNHLNAIINPVFWIMAIIMEGLMAYEMSAILPIFRCTSRHHNQKLWLYNTMNEFIYSMYGTCERIGLFYGI